MEVCHRSICCDKRVKELSTLRHLLRDSVAENALILLSLRLPVHWMVENNHGVPGGSPEEQSPLQNTPMKLVSLTEAKRNSFRKSCSPHENRLVHTNT